MVDLINSLEKFGFLVWDLEQNEILSSACSCKRKIGILAPRMSFSQRILDWLSLGVERRYVIALFNFDANHLVFFETDYPFKLYQTISQVLSSTLKTKIKIEFASSGRWLLTLRKGLPSLIK